MRPTKIFSLFILTILISIHALSAGDLGVGIIIGEPTGLSLKKWIDADRAFDAGIAWSFSGNNSIHFHADYMVHRFGVLQSLDLPGRSAFYFGLGGRIKLIEDQIEKVGDDQQVQLGIRVPLGISYKIADAPIDLFVEVVPVLDLVPDTDIDLNAAIGARFYF